MPQRSKSGGNDNGGGVKTAPTSNTVATKQPDIPVIEQLAHFAGVYLFMAEKVKEFDNDKKKAGEDIKQILQKHPEVLQQVGAHREVTVDIPAALQVLIRLQTSMSVAYADDTIQFLRNKLGSEAEQYIIKREELAEGAIEALYNAGKISKDEAEGALVVTKKEALYVKEVGTKPKRHKK